MLVNYTDIFIDDEDEMQSIETYLNSLEYIYNTTSAKWFWLQEEWNAYIIKKQHLKKQLQVLKRKKD